MTNDAWVKIIEVPEYYKAHILEDTLQLADIACVVVNKKDSSYNNFGNYQIFVPAFLKERALQIINEAN